MMIKLNCRIYIFENRGVAVTKPRPIYAIVPWAPLSKVLEITIDLQSYKMSTATLVFHHVYINNNNFGIFKFRTRPSAK